MIDESPIYLTQTDTTVGFLSASPKRLALAKKRDVKQPFLICVDTFKKQKKLARTPKKFRSLVRKSRKTTFLYPNKKAIRMVTQGVHSDFLKKFDFLYSTSANQNKKSFVYDYAYAQADILIENATPFRELPPSPIIKLGKTQKKSLR